MPTRAACLIVAGLLATAGRARAAETETPETPAWRANASIYRYVVPEEPDFTMAVAAVDFGRVHFEGRYNYEGLNAASLFAGFDVAAGERVRLAMTPMLGVVFGDLHGLIPAVRLTLAWWKLDLYTESELVIDVEDAGASFVYDWSELAISPWSWLRAGIVAQRNRVLRTPLDIQRGLFVGVTIKFATVSFYELNAGWTDPTYIAALGLAF